MTNFWLNLKRDTEVTETLIGRFEKYPLRFYLDSGYCNGDPLWLVGEEFGPMMLIAARSFDAAWECYIDESPTIPESEVCEAYGFSTQAELDAAVNSGEEPDLVEGYEHQPNASGTGIVSVSDYLWIHELERSDLKRYGIVIKVARVS